MNLNTTTKTPWHLWVVGAVTLLWNSGGVISYTMTKLNRLEGMGVPPEHIEYYLSFPAWATVFWALGVWGAFFGSVFLLLRKSWAVPVLMLSVVGLIVTTVFQWFLSDLPESLNTSGHMAFAASIWVITLAMLWYAMRMRSQGVLR